MPLSVEDHNRVISQYKLEIKRKLEKRLKEENKKYKVLRQNQYMPGSSRTSTFEHKQRIKKILV